MRVEIASAPNHGASRWNNLTLDAIESLADADPAADTTTVDPTTVDPRAVDTPVPPISPSRTAVGTNPGTDQRQPVIVFNTSHLQNSTPATSSWATPVGHTPYGQTPYGQTPKGGMTPMNRRSFNLEQLQSNLGGLLGSGSSSLQLGGGSLGGSLTTASFGLAGSSAHALHGGSHLQLSSSSRALSQRNSVSESLGLADHVKMLPTNPIAPDSSLFPGRRKYSVMAGDEVGGGIPDRALSLLSRLSGAQELQDRLSDKLQMLSGGSFGAEDSSATGSLHVGFLDPGSSSGLGSSFGLGAVESRDLQISGGKTKKSRRKRKKELKAAGRGVGGKTVIELQKNEDIYAIPDDVDQIAINAGRVSGEPQAARHSADEPQAAVGAPKAVPGVGTTTGGPGTSMGAAAGAPQRPFTPLVISADHMVWYVDPDSGLCHVMAGDREGGYGYRDDASGVLSRFSSPKGIVQVNVYRASGSGRRHVGTVPTCGPHCRRVAHTPPEK